MAPELVDTWLKIAASALSIAAFFIALIATRRKAINERLDAGSKRMDAHDVAIAELRKQVSGLPAKDDLHRLELELREIAGTIREHRAMSEANRDMMQRTLASLERVEGYLLSQGDK